MYFEAALGFVDGEGFDYYREVVVEAISLDEAQVAAHAVVAGCVDGHYTVMGAVASVKQIQVCLTGAIVPRGQKVQSPLCAENNLLVPTGRVPWGIEETAPLLCEGEWVWVGRWVEAPLAEAGNCP